MPSHFRNAVAAADPDPDSVRRPLIQRMGTARARRPSSAGIPTLAPSTPLLLRVASVLIGNWPAALFWAALCTANTIGYWFQLAPELTSTFFQCPNMIPVAFLVLISFTALGVTRRLVRLIPRQQASINTIAGYLARHETCCGTILAISGSAFMLDCTKGVAVGPSDDHSLYGDYSSASSSSSYADGESDDCCVGPMRYLYRVLDAASWPVPWRAPVPRGLYCDDYNYSDASGGGGNADGMDDYTDAAAPTNIRGKRRTAEGGGTGNDDGTGADNRTDSKRKPLLHTTPSPTSTSPTPTPLIAGNLFNRPRVQLLLMCFSLGSLCVAVPTALVYNVLVNDLRWSHGVLTTCWQTSAYANFVWLLVCPLVIFPGLLVFWALHNQTVLFKLHAMMRVPHSHLSWGRPPSMYPVPPAFAAAAGTHPPPPLLPYCLLPASRGRGGEGSGESVGFYNATPAVPLDAGSSVAPSMTIAPPLLSVLDVQNITTAEFIVDLHRDVVAISGALSPFVVSTTLPFGLYAFIASFQYISESTFLVYLAFVVAAWAAALLFPLAVWVSGDGDGAGRAVGHAVWF